MKFRRKQFSWLHDNLDLVALLLGFICLSIVLAFQQILNVRHFSAIELSALSAAKEISAVVIEDRYFGRIGLSARPALNLAGVSSMGKTATDFGTVRSINSILAGVRVQLIVADLLASDSLKKRALYDYNQARRAAVGLERELSLSLDPNCKKSFSDAYGRKVSPLATALRAYKCAYKSADLLSTPTLPSFSLRWSATQGATLTHIPAPYKFAFCGDAQEQNDLYRPGVDANYGDAHFIFAATGTQPMFINPAATRKADGFHFSSLVCAQISDSVYEKNPSSSTVCVQPMAIESPDANEKFEIELPKHYHRTAKLPHLCGSELSGQFSDWLASSGGRINIESLVAALQTEISNSTAAGATIALQTSAGGLVSVAHCSLPPVDSTTNAAAAPAPAPAEATDYRRSRQPLARSHNRHDHRESYLR